MNTINAKPHLKQRWLDAIILTTGLVISVVGYLGHHINWLAMNF